MNYRIIAVVTAMAMLILLPPIKAVYDGIVTDLLMPLGPNSVAIVFFTLLPYGLLGLIIFGTIWKLFRGPPGEGGL